MATKNEKPDDIELPEFIMEPKKEQGVVGDRIWGPYRVHSGIPNSEKYSGGPHGLGDPDDQFLRRVESTILIPNMIKKKANATWCQVVNEQFFKCAEQYGMWRMSYKCRAEATELRECVHKVLTDESKVNEVTQEYLDMRAEYRRTGKRKLLKRA